MEPMSSDNPTLAVPAVPEAVLEANLRQSAEAEIAPSVAPPPPGKEPSMDHSLIRAIAWTGAGKWATQLLAWVCTITVARILSPSDYGVMGMATMYLGMVNLISEFGMGQSVITLRQLSKRQIAQINSIALFFGVGLFAVSSALAKPLGHFFRSPQLPTVIVVMSVGFVVYGFQVVPDALLQRDLRFKLIASFDTMRGLSQALGTVLLAWLGFGYWSLALGSLSGTVIYTALVVAARRHIFAWPNLREIKAALGFSADVLGSRVAWYSYSNSDFMVAGRVLGETSLGSYTMAWTLASTPVEKIANMVMKVTPAFFSAVQDDKPQLRRYLLGITEGLALLCFPASIGLAVVADQFVAAVLGPKWTAAATPLRLLAIYAALRSLTTVLPNLLNARRKSRFVMWNTVVAAAVFPAAFYLTSRWGTTGIAAAWMVLYPAIAAPMIWKSARELDLPIWTYLSALLPALRGCVVMVAVVCGARFLMPGHWPMMARFIVAVIAGALAYGGFLMLAERKRLRSFYSLIQGARA
jgi:O-antigen/teichoic acid export membrane protein